MFELGRELGTAIAIEIHATDAKLERWRSKYILRGNLYEHVGYARLKSHENMGFESE
jgi:hypothetical protein